MAKVRSPITSKGRADAKSVSEWHAKQREVRRGKELRKQSVVGTKKDPRLASPEARAAAVAALRKEMGG